MAKKRRRARKKVAKSSKKSSSKGGSSPGLYLTAIVGIVAVVAVVIMVMNAGGDLEVGGDELTGLVVGDAEFCSQIASGADGALEQRVNVRGQTEFVKTTKYYAAFKACTDNLRESHKKRNADFK